jgi:hypothetical protein
MKHRIVRAENKKKYEVWRYWKARATGMMLASIEELNDVLAFQVIFTGPY